MRVNSSYSTGPSCGEQSVIPRHIQLLWAAQGACGAATLMVQAVVDRMSAGELDEAVEYMAKVPVAVMIGARAGAVGLPVPGIFCVGTRLVNWARRRAWEE